MARAFLDLISAKQSFLLCGHEHPDGDCLGSEVALYHLLRSLGKTVHIWNPGPVPRSLDFLHRHTPIGDFREDRQLPDVEVLVLLDCARLSRLEELGRALAARRPLIAVVDHHVGSEEGDGEVCYIDATAPSTGALIHDLYRELGVALPAAAAEGVFLTLVADTGWFRYSNTDARVLAIAAELAAAGIEPSAMYDAMFRRNSPRSLSLLCEALQASAVELNGRFGYVCFDKNAVRRLAEADFETDMVIDPLRSIEGVEVVGLFKERFDGAVKLSLRARGDLDVREIALAFGGGGHVKAAGAVLSGPMSRAVSAVRERVEAALATAVDPGREA